MAQASLSTLQMYEERMGDKFSTLHFQDLKSKACAVRLGAAGMMRVWNAAWVQCQEVRRRLEQMQKKNMFIDNNQNQQTAAVITQEEAEGMEKEERRIEAGETEGTLTPQLTSPKEVDDITDKASETDAAPCLNHYLNPVLKETGESPAAYLPEAAVENKTPFCSPNAESHTDAKWGLREHHSEAELRSAGSVEVGDDLPWRRPFGRSLSEGSCVSARLTFGFSPLNVRQTHCRSGAQELNVQPIPNLPASQSQILYSVHLNCKAQRDSDEVEGCPTEGCTVSTQSPKDSRTPETLLIPSDNNGSNVL